MNDKSASGDDVVEAELESAPGVEDTRPEATDRLEEQRNELARQVESAKIGFQGGVESAKIEFQAAIESAKMEFQATLDGALELFRSTRTAGHNFMRTSVTLNGGAALAILALIAQLPESGMVMRDNLAQAFVFLSGGALAVLRTVIDIRLPSASRRSPFSAASGARHTAR